MKFNLRRLIVLMIAVGSLFSAFPALAENAIDDSAALNGVTETKSVFLIDFTN